MCTVSVLQRPVPACGRAAPPPRWRLVCNRDEQRARPVALRPVVGRLGAFRMASPIDPEGPGTWVAATTAGLVFALLNGRPGAGAGTFTSRGRVIPLVAGAADLDDAVVRLGRLRSLGTRPFTLLVAGDDGVLQCESDGHAIVSMHVTTDSRLMHTSSSLEPDAVRASRHLAFRRQVTTVDAVAQDAFHWSADAERPAHGVLMARPDACTVSVTTIEMHEAHLRLAYRPVPGTGPSTELELPRVR